MFDATIQKYIPNTKVVIEKGLSSNIYELIDSLAIGDKFTIVSDINTHKILGKKIEQALGKFSIESLVLADGIADMASVSQVSLSAQQSDAIIAVGSGTINDICKYASCSLNKPYIVCGTAPSMNGYSSANASITVDGHKKTLKAHLPRAILLDLDILAQAPKRLIRSGLGDSICRPTAQADWLLSHLVLNSKYDTTPFDILQPVEQPLFDNADALIAGDLEVVELLAQTLTLSGIGMYIAGGSYPASQGEHLIAHTMATVYKNLPQTYHGEQIGVTTLTMAGIIKQQLGQVPVLTENFDDGKILQFFGSEIGQQCLAEYSAKIFSAQQLDELNHHISQNWGNIAQQIDDIMIYENDLQQILHKADAHSNCESLGWQAEQYQQAVSYAKYMRDRFGFLDLGTDHS